MPPPAIEAIARVLSSMPVPPMPIVVGQEVPDEITCVSGEHTIANSHDLWAMLLLKAMERDNRSDNLQRKEAQQKLAAEFLEAARKLGKCSRSEDKGIEARVYELFQDFTRKNIGLLSDKQNLQFALLDSVKREDRVHIAACHHAAAQDMLFGRLETDAVAYEKQSAEAFSSVPYTGIMMRQFARMSETASGSE